MEEKEVRYIVYEYNKNASPNYQGTRFMTTWSEPKVELPESNVIIVAQDISEAEAYKLCEETEAKNWAAFIMSFSDYLPKQNI